MSQVQTLPPRFAPAVMPQVRSRPAARPAAPPSLPRCLIVSTNEHRSEMFREAAAQQGWDVVLCDSAPDALRESFRHRLQMVIVDLDTAGQAPPDGFQALTERFADERRRLLIVCGNEGDVMEEIWARQIGAWMYLPGVDEQSDVAMLCGEARNVAEKLTGSGAPAQAAG